MMTIIWPLLVALLGLLVYAFASSVKPMEVGRITFFCGLFWVVYLVAGKAFHLPG